MGELADMRVVNLWKRFGRTEVLRGASLDFPKGQITVVLGPSGCGKSVLLKHLVGLLRPDRGEVWFGPARIDRMPERELGIIRRQIGFLFQQSALFDSLTVRENIAFPLREHGLEEERLINERVTRVLSLVGLEETRDQMPSELSGGQRKRVALARAVVLEPRVVLYDEPTTGLDPIRAEVINELILKFAGTLGVTSIVVTHDLVSAFRIADRMVLLHDGKVVLEGTPDEFKTTTEPTARQFLRGEVSEAELEKIRRHGDDVRQPQS
jgi:phospholipid/cholesterol/gamma-HCH transport system ATP-binding protein